MKYFVRFEEKHKAEADENSKIIGPFEEKIFLQNNSLIAGKHFITTPGNPAGYGRYYDRSIAQYLPDVFTCDGRQNFYWYIDADFDPELKRVRYSHIYIYAEE